MNEDHISPIKAGLASCPWYLVVPDTSEGLSLQVKLQQVVGSSPLFIMHRLSPQTRELGKELSRS